MTSMSGKHRAETGDATVEADLADRADQERTADPVEDDLAASHATHRAESMPSEAADADVAEQREPALREPDDER